MSKLRVGGTFFVTSLLLQGSTLAQGPVGEIAELSTDLIENEVRRLGVSMAMCDVNADHLSDLIVGATDGFSEGRVYVYYGNALGPELAPGWTDTREDELSCFGCAVACVSDLDGDGGSEILVAAPLAGSDTAGKVYLYWSSSKGPTLPPQELVHTSTPGGQFGTTLVGLGDVDHNGTFDFAVSAPFEGDANQGRFYIFGIVGDGKDVTQLFASDLGSTEASLGLAMTGAGDVNGDGNDDFAIGAPFYSTEDAPAMGRAGIYFGNEIPELMAEEAFVENEPEEGTFTGYALAGGFDINGDTVADLLVGSPGYEASSGLIDIYSGGDIMASGKGLVPAESLLGGRLEGLGTSLSFVGDLNGDGHADFASGSTGGGTEGDGAVAVFYGAEDLRAITRVWDDSPAEVVGANFGQVIAGPGDLDGDGYLEFAVAAPDWHSADSDALEGRIWLYEARAATGEICARDSDCKGTCEDGFCCAVSCGVCGTCSSDGNSCVQLQDDPGCGVVDCDGLDDACNDYASVREDRCLAVGQCKAPNQVGTCSSVRELECDTQDAGTTSDAGPTTTTTPKKKKSGCAVGDVPASPLGSLPLLGLGMALVVRRRRRRR